MLDVLGNNPYFNAGAGLVGLGVVIAGGKSTLRSLSHVLLRKFTVSLEVTSRDRSCGWLLNWLTEKNVLPTTHVSVITYSHQLAQGRTSWATTFVPNVGVHYFFYDRRLFKLERTRETSMMDINTGTPFETVQLTTFGTTPLIMSRILAEAQKYAADKQEGKTVIYTTSGVDWKPNGEPRRRRPLDSVILDERIADQLVSDVKSFLTLGKWYSDRGIPYRRGYLLHGPPGCGKSSFVFALAGELDYDICCLNLAGGALSDDRLQHFLSTAPQRSIILIEDIDAAISTRPANFPAEMYNHCPNQVTFSGLLNALDGVISSEGRILFMTTNHIGHLDDALTRPGRVDLKVHFSYTTPSQLQRMYLRFFPDQDGRCADRFAEAVAHLGVPISAAAVQGHFMLHRNDAQAALANIGLLLEAKK